jgi:hypothetical protein
MKWIFVKPVNAFAEDGKILSKNNEPLANILVFINSEEKLFSIDPSSLTKKAQRLEKDLADKTGIASKFKEMHQASGFCVAQHDYSFSYKYT